MTSEILGRNHPHDSFHHNNIHLITLPSLKAHIKTTIPGVTVSRSLAAEAIYKQTPIHRVGEGG